MIYLIDMSGTMLGSMPEVVQKAEIPYLTHYRLGFKQVLGRAVASRKALNV